MTFYTYYNNKYDLLADMYRSMADEAQASFLQRQKDNNPQDSFEKSLQNLLDTLLSFEDNPAFSADRLRLEQKIVPMYHDFLLECIRRFEIRYPEYLQSRYPVQQLNSFIAFGLWRFAQPPGTGHRQRPGGCPDADKRSGEQPDLKRKPLTLRLFLPCGF